MGRADAYGKYQNIIIDAETQLVLVGTINEIRGTSRLPDVPCRDSWRELFATLLKILSSN